MRPSWAGIAGWVLVLGALWLGWVATPPADGRTVVAVFAAVVGVLLIAAARDRRPRS